MVLVTGGFQEKKAKILRQLAVPESEYEDLSPKGSIDIEIRDLVDDINRQEDLVTTSSCAGRVAVYLEGSTSERHEDHDDESSDTATVQIPSSTSAGGKGNGRWLYVSHDPVHVLEHTAVGSVYNKLGLHGIEQAPPEAIVGARFCHFKFEPLVGAFVSTIRHRSTR